MVTKRNHSQAGEAKAIIDNPSHKDLRQFTAQMDNAQVTVLGNYDVFTRVDSRSTSSTFIVTDTPKSTAATRPCPARTTPRSSTCRSDTSPPRR